MPALSAAEVIELMHRTFPQARAERLDIDSVGEGALRARYRTDERDLRPGQTISGPTLMALSDMAVYFMILAEVGPMVLAVTTSLNINFLRKPSPGELTVEGKLLKLGKRLAVGEVSIFSEGASEPVSHATVTYSIPR